MEKNFLMNKINNIQNEYLKMLLKIKDKIDTVDYMYIIDEINIFWYSYREAVTLYLSNITPQDKAYIFTGATYLDVDDLEHFPFVMMGTIHIVDDPLCKYSRIVPECKSQDFSKTLRNQIISSVNDNIKILSEYSFAILILPLHLLYDNDMKLISNAANDAFLNLFSIENINRDIYLEKFSSIQDVASALQPGIEKYIVFDEKEDLRKSLTERFKNYIDKTNVPLSEGRNDAFKFWILVYSFIIQALDIILCCSKFNLIPYLRYGVTFQYVTMLGENFSAVKGSRDMLFKCKIAHALYIIFDKEKIRDISFVQFYKNLNEYNFSEKVEESLSKNNIDLNNINVEQMVGILNNNIEICLTQR